jgi:hypothetical protein
VSVSRTMGLFAVGRLATRHDIRVQLRESASGGITAVVRLPAKVVAGDTSTTPVRPAAGGPGGRPSAGNRPMLDSHLSSMANGTALPAGAVSPNGVSSNSGGHVNGHLPVNGNGPGPADPRPGFTPDRPAPTLNGNSADGVRGHGQRSETDSAATDTRFRQPRSGRSATGPDLGLEKMDAGGSASDTGPHPVAGAPAERGPASDSYQLPRRSDATRYPRPSDTGSINIGPVGAGGPSDPGVSGAMGHGVPDAAWPAVPPTGPELLFGQEAAGPGTYGSGHPHEAIAADSGQLADPAAGHISTPLDNSGFTRANTPADPGPERETDEADTTPIFDSVSAWFQRRSPGPALPTRHPTPPQSPLRRPGPAIHHGPVDQRGDSRPPEATERLNVRGDMNTTGETTHPGSPFPHPATRQGGGTADLPVRMGGGMDVPPVYSPDPLPNPTVTGPGDGLAVTAGPDLLSWSSAGDAGWQAAEAAHQPTSGGTTQAGLPLRVPRTHLVPGSAEPGPRRRPPDAPARSPEAVGNRLASFYHGVRQGRDTTKDAAPIRRRDAQEDM